MYFRYRKVVLLNALNWRNDAWENKNHRSPGSQQNFETHIKTVVGVGKIGNKQMTIRRYFFPGSHLCSRTGSPSVYKTNNANRIPAALLKNTRRHRRISNGLGRQWPHQYPKFLTINTEALAGKDDLKIRPVSPWLRCLQADTLKSYCTDIETFDWNMTFTRVVRRNCWLNRTTSTGNSSREVSLQSTETSQPDKTSKPN